MKTTGITRKLDELGRITIPKEIRDHLGIPERDALHIFLDEKNERIVLEKYFPCDMFTGEREDLIDYHDNKVSKNSIIEMAKLAGFKVK
ncbi:MAG: AbrB family transcriptional regulator [Clostridia bacterium]|nr:AbrB family transcriptional regulator [Clostridia bacterium]